ncbi:uncharacterized protein JCM6883_007248 [Sporobolomyces salmoneus]|uniref:uncharacterized protein n=1 Tax=Sporobolomyces salmoneus TaxID=183962 RepID=UPI0031780A10
MSSSSPTSSPSSPPCPIAFLTHLISLVESEQAAEAIESSLLIQNTPLSILIKSGLALNNLSLSSTSGGFSIGLGGKTLVELGKSSHLGEEGRRFPPNDFRVGDLVKVRNQGSGTTTTKKKAGGGKGKAKEGKEEEGIEAVVYKVGNEKITFVLNRSQKEQEEEEKDGFEWSDRITIMKVSNPSTFTRQIHFLRRAIRTIEATQKTSSPSNPVETEKDDDSSSSSESEEVDEKEEEPSATVSCSPEDTARLRGLLEKWRRDVRDTWPGFEWCSLDEILPSPVIDTIVKDAKLIKEAYSLGRLSTEWMRKEREWILLAGREELLGLLLHWLRTQDSELPLSPPPPPSSAIEPSSADPPSSVPPTLSPLLSVLLGLSPPTRNTSDPSLSISKLDFFDPLLNASQKEAISFSLAANEISMIWGPPGTGKTQTLVEIIRQLVLVQQKRVLVCGASNLSVDNILLRLSQPSIPSSSTGVPIPTIPLTRLGHPARILSSLTPHTLDSQSLSSDTSSLVRDIKSELLTLEQSLASRDKRLRIKGSARKEKWDQVRSLRRDMKKRLNGITREVLSDKKVVLGTTHAAGGRVLDRMEEFDVVIIDEAAQATEPACWIPIMRGEKLILAGDHLQLPPTLKSVSSSSTSSSSSAATHLPPHGPSPLSLPSSLETTLFSRLLTLHGSESIRRMLKVQYRFNDKINEFPNRMLYDGELIADETVKGRRLGDLLVEGAEEAEEGKEADLEDLNEEIVFFDTAGLAMYERSGGDDGENGTAKGYGSESKSNENEADIVVNYVKFLIESGIPPTSISLISPYSSQVSLLSSLLHPLYPSLEIGSIDSNQGRENDVVIISLVRSNESGEIGFLKEMRRLNVAMTRPRRQLVVVGDSETLKKQGSTRTTTTKKKRKESGDAEKGKSKTEKDIVEENASAEKNDRQEEEEEESRSESETEEVNGTSSTPTEGKETTPIKPKRKQKKVTGARYLKEWIEWLEQNAYVRVP